MSGEQKLLQEPKNIKEKNDRETRKKEERKNACKEREKTKNKEIEKENERRGKIVTGTKRGEEKERNMSTRIKEKGSRKERKRMRGEE